MRISHWDGTIRALVKNHAKHVLIASLMPTLAESHFDTYQNETAGIFAVLNLRLAWLLQTAFIVPYSIMRINRHFAMLNWHDLNKAKFVTISNICAPIWTAVS